MPTPNRAYAELEIGLHRVQPGHYEVELRFTDPRSQAEIAPARGAAPLDLERLLTLRLDPQDYGEALAAAVFHDQAVDKLYAQVKTAVEGTEKDRQFRPVPADYEGRISDELKTIMEFPGYTADNMSKFKEKYAALGPTPSNTRYGWMRTKV